MSGGGGEIDVDIKCCEYTHQRRGISKYTQPKLTHPLQSEIPLISRIQLKEWQALPGYL